MKSVVYPFIVITKSSVRFGMVIPVKVTSLSQV